MHDTARELYVRGGAETKFYAQLFCQQLRHRTTKWIIKTMHANTETVDRGFFISLLNAARDGYW